MRGWQMALELEKPEPVVDLMTVIETTSIAMICPYCGSTRCQDMSGQYADDHWVCWDCDGTFNGWNTMSHPMRNAWELAKQAASPRAHGGQP